MQINIQGGAEKFSAWQKQRKSQTREIRERGRDDFLIMQGRS